MENNTQARKWALVINNPLEAGLDHAAIREILYRFSPTYFCMADEIATTGTYHTHIFLFSPSPMRFSTVKNRFATAHIEKAYGSAKTNRAYILKEGRWADTDKAETSVPGTFEEWGDLPAEKEEEAPEMFKLIQDLRAGKSVMEIIEDNPKLAFRIREIETLRQAILEEKYSAENRALEVTYLYGASGTGKTRGIFETHDRKSICRITDYGGRNGVRFDAYHCQDVLVLEEFHSQIPISAMLNYLDIYPLTLPARYTDRIACYTKVYITSNIPLEEQYRDIQRYQMETWRAFLRRVQNVIEYLPDGSTVQHKKGAFPMTQNEKFQVQRRNTLRNLWQKLSGTPEFPVKLVLAALYLMGAAYVCVKQAAWRTLAGNIPLLSPLLKAAMEHALTAYLLAGAATLPVLLLYPFGRRAAKDQLQCIGLVNHAGVPPDLLRKRRDKDKPRVTVWEFRNQSIPLQEWDKKRLAIETALGITIVKLTYAKGKSRVLVYAVSAGDDLPEVLKWKDSYLSPKSFVLVLGESYTGPVTVNLAHIPHILLGGSTGSGKSVLLKLLLMQALHKGAEVYITDFKGGVDFPKVWHEKCRMCFTEEDLCNILDRLVEELERRKSAFKALGCPNIDAYNEIAERPLQRLIFACDEVAEMLDKTGADNERKKLLAQIENKLSTIARQGRAFGIHLILATQRPDATIIPGQIRNNMDFRVCGRADSVLSQIILDSTGAAEQIPKDARGRFITGDGTVFQGYLFDENAMFEDEGKGILP